MPSMTREDALTKLAMEVAEWPKSYRDIPAGLIPYAIWSMDRGGDSDGGRVSLMYIHCSDWEDTINEHEWMAERQRLINKPSWADAPEWVDWLAQDEPGRWFWYRVEPEFSEHFCGFGVGVHSENFTKASEGRIPAGHDWRTTLERRPDSQKPALSTGCMNSGMGQKYDTDKPMMGLIPPKAEEALARVLTFGAKKYAPDNWRKVDDAQRRYMDACMRHLNAHRQGEVADPETGESHLAHAACCVMFLLELVEEEK